MNTEKIRQALSDRRKERGLTQAELAALAGVSRDVVSYLENDHHDIGLRRFARLCAVLDLELIVRPGSGRPVLEDLDQLFKDEEA
jgi:HTH-type transcriptional regulator / antitoxin HipB